MRKTDKYRQTPQFCGVRPLLFFLRAPHAGSERIAPFICSLTDFSLVNFFSSANNRMKLLLPRLRALESRHSAGFARGQILLPAFLSSGRFLFFVKPLTSQIPDIIPLCKELPMVATASLYGQKDNRGFGKSAVIFFLYLSRLQMIITPFPVYQRTSAPSYTAAPSFSKAASLLKKGSSRRICSFTNR